jgi:hypothetical protein
MKKSDEAAASYVPRSRRGKACLTPTFKTTANGMIARVGATLAVAPTPIMPQQQGKARLDPTLGATARVAPTPTTGQDKACRTTGESGTAEQGIAQGPVKTERAKTLQIKGEKSNKKITENRKINKNEKKYAKRICGKP